MNLNDYLTELTDALERNEGNDEDAILGRCIAFRKVLKDWGDSRHQEGYGDGIRDAHRAQHAAKRAERERAERNKPQLCPTPCDAGCEPDSLVCHERHKPAGERSHDPVRCEADA